jgi:hypothetical protein
MHLAIAGMYSMFMSLGQVGATSLPTTPSEVVNPFDATNGTKASTGAWSRILRGHTGVAAMQITVVNDRYALILDRVSQYTVFIFAVSYSTEHWLFQLTNRWSVIP